jgi:hypothetical protein
LGLRHKQAKLRSTHEWNPVSEYMARESKFLKYSNTTIMKSAFKKTSRRLPKYWLGQICVFIGGLFLRIAGVPAVASQLALQCRKSFFPLHRLFFQVALIKETVS